MKLFDPLNVYFSLNKLGLSAHIVCDWKLTVNPLQLALLLPRGTLSMQVILIYLILEILYILTVKISPNIDEKITQSTRNTLKDEKKITQLETMDRKITKLSLSLSLSLLKVT